VQVNWVYSGPSSSFSVLLDLIRTRDPSKLQECTVVVDVGGIYDEKIQRFDHHQKGFDEVFGHGFNTKLSSAGLIYKSVSWVPGIPNLITQSRHFGREIIRNRLRISNDDQRVETLYLKLYGVGLIAVVHSIYNEHPKDFIEGIDGIDNGVLQYPADIPPKYRVRTDLSSRVGWLNPAWNEPADRTTIDASFFLKPFFTRIEPILRLASERHQN
jgi:uncharacterized UPF0160 family protein